MAAFCCAVSGEGVKKASEYQVKAAFVFKFTKFVTWQSNCFSAPNSAFVIAVIGDDPFGKNLDDIVQGEEVQGRPIEIRRVGRGGAVPPCHLLFISGSEASRLKNVLSEVKGNTLTVADFAGAADQGVAFNLLLANGNVTIEINQGAVDSSGLQVSSKLLRLSKIVGTQTRTEAKKQ
jgi:hypothetical protein